MNNLLTNLVLLTELGGKVKPIKIVKTTGKFNTG